MFIKELVSIESHSSLRGPDCPALSAPTVHAWQHEGQRLSGASLWNLGGLHEAVGLQSWQMTIRTEAAIRALQRNQTKAGGTQVAASLIDFEGETTYTPIATENHPLESWHAVLPRERFTGSQYWEPLLWRKSLG